MLCGNVCALTVWLWFHSNVSTSNQCCSCLHQQNRLACIGSSVEIETKYFYTHKHLDQHVPVRNFLACKIVSIFMSYHHRINTHFHRHASIAVATRHPRFIYCTVFCLCILVDLVSCSEQNDVKNIECKQIE